MLADGDLRSLEFATKQLRKEVSEARRPLNDLNRTMSKFDERQKISRRRDPISATEIELAMRRIEVLLEVTRKRDFLNPPEPMLERRFKTTLPGAVFGARAGAKAGRIAGKRGGPVGRVAGPIVGGGIGGFFGGGVGFFLPEIIDKLNPKTVAGLTHLQDKLLELTATRDQLRSEIEEEDEALRKRLGLSKEEISKRGSARKTQLAIAKGEIAEVLADISKAFEEAIADAPKEMQDRLRSIDPQAVFREVLESGVAVPEFRLDPRIDPRSPAFRDLHDRVGPEGGVVLPLPTDSLRDLNSRLEDTRDRLSFVRDEMQGVTAVTGGFSNIIEGTTGDTKLLGGAFDDLLVGADKASAGLQETLGEVLPELGDKTDELTIKIEDSMARAREAVEDLADGLGTVLDEALRGQIQSFEDFGRRVLEILREIGFGLLEEEGLDPKSLIRKAIGSIFDDNEGETPPLPRRRPEGMEGLGALAAADVANNPDIFGGLPAVSEQVAVSLQNAGVAAGLLEGSGLGASEVLGSSLAAEALNAAFAATTETAASQALVGVLVQLTAAAQSAAVALQSVAASAGAGGGGGGGGLGFLSSFFNPTSSAARPGGGFGAPGAVNPGPGFPVRLQHGGFAEAFRPAIVGESGPEMIVPHVPSTVIPNNALGGVTLNVSINAPGADRAGTDAIREEVRQLRGVVAALNSGIEPRALAAVSGKANRGGGFARTVGRRG